MSKAVFARLKAFPGARAMRRLWRARSGIAAVEFAFIMPLMLVLYLGLAVLGQGLEISRKVQLASRTLADLTSQQLASSLTGAAASGNCTTHTTVPCLSNTDLMDIYAGAKLVMTPFDTSATVMSAAISEIIFDNVSTTDKRCCQARVAWSVGFGASPPVRSCGAAGLTPVANGINGVSSMPKGNYPGGQGDVLNNAQVLNGSTNNATDYYVIVADVTYAFKPGYDFKLFNWGGAGGTYTISQTTYMTPRNGASLAQPNTLVNGTQQTQAILWPKDATMTSGSVTISVSHNCIKGTDYYLP
jgi:Flp pilus assembly protein TadG